MMEATHAVAEPQLSKGARTIAKQDHNIRLRPAEVLRRGWRLRRRGILPQVLQLSPEPSVLRPEGRQLVCWQGMRCKHPADHRREHGAPSRVPACTAGGCCHSRLCRRWDTFSLSAQQTITLPSSRHRQDYHSLLARASSSIASRRRLRTGALRCAAIASATLAPADWSAGLWTRAPHHSQIALFFPSAENESSRGPISTSGAAAEVEGSIGSTYVGSATALAREVPVHSSYSRIVERFSADDA